MAAQRPESGSVTAVIVIASPARSMGRMMLRINRIAEGDVSLAGLNGDQIK